VETISRRLMMIILGLWALVSVPVVLFPILLIGKLGKKTPLTVSEIIEMCIEMCGDVLSKVKTSW
jgi:hypothetical protein